MKLFLKCATGIYYWIGNQIGLEVPSFCLGKLRSLRENQDLAKQLLDMRSSHWLMPFWSHFEILLEWRPWIGI